MSDSELKSRREDQGGSGSVGRRREMREHVGEYVVVLDGGRPWGVRLHSCSDSTGRLPTLAAASDNSNSGLSSSVADQQQQQQQYVTVAKVRVFLCHRCIQCYYHSLMPKIH